MNRRTFLKQASAAAAAFTAAQRIGAPSTALAAADERTFWTAGQAAEAVRSKTVSSVELTELMIGRIERYNPDLNAIVVPMLDKAREGAKRADAAVAAGGKLGLLHGVPVTVKESYDIAGYPTTVGLPGLKNNIAQEDATAVQRLREAGAVVLGKTNVPVMLGDIQSYNPVYGSTNNPWDHSRTCGGSSGGEAASIAAGMSYAGIGSDIGGSLRSPAHFCGVFSHKPTLNLFPQLGHVPPLPNQLPAPPATLPVSGPLARSASDLRMMMRTLAGPDGVNSRAYAWSMPPARKKDLKNYRIGYVLDDPMCPVVPEQKAVFDEMLGQLESAGATLQEGWPEGMDPVAQLESYIVNLLAALGPLPPISKEVYQAYAETSGKTPPIDVPALQEKVNTMGLREYQQWDRKRIVARDGWQQYFESFDAFLLPVVFVTAFPHDHSFQMARTLDTSLGIRPYFDLLYWISIATHSGLPATACPVGRTSEGMPASVQILGPYLEDDTPLHIAECISELTGGFVAPPNYA